MGAPSLNWCSSIWPDMHILIYFEVPIVPVTKPEFTFGILSKSNFSQRLIEVQVNRRSFKVLENKLSLCLFKYILSLLFTSVADFCMNTCSHKTQGATLNKLRILSQGWPDHSWAFLLHSLVHLKDADSNDVFKWNHIFLAWHSDKLKLLSLIAESHTEIIRYWCFR